jgi:3-methyl-2-oxobutanoate hydroxymethyltransferase
MSPTSHISTRITIPALLQKKQKRERITMLTAYDFPSAYLLDQSDTDIVLVGDSLAMTVLGHENTLSITMEEMIYHTRAVSKACKRALVVGDMPFGSYQGGINQAITNGMRFIKEGQCAAVKLEGGKHRASVIAAMVEAEIPVMAHIGLTPQSMHRFGGFKVQGKSVDAAMAILEDAFAVQEAGAFAVVLESIPTAVAAEITPRLRIPTIGIGAGVHCDGQVLVWHDFLGLHENRVPRFVKKYADLYPQMLQAANQYCEEVREGKFPDEEHGYCMPDQELFFEKVEEKYGNYSAHPSNEGKLEESKV